MNNIPVKRGRGRPKGSKSFVNVSLEQLNAMLPPGTVVPVSQVWLKKLGLPIAPPQPVAQTVIQAKSNPSKTAEKLEFSVE